MRCTYNISPKGSNACRSSESVKSSSRSPTKMVTLAVNNNRFASVILIPEGEGGEGSINLSRVDRQSPLNWRRRKRCYEKSVPIKMFRWFKRFIFKGGVSHSKLIKNHRFEIFFCDQHQETRTKDWILTPNNLWRTPSTWVRGPIDLDFLKKHLDKFSY